MERGLYIHIPFCVRKCRYCDFPSYAGLYSPELAAAYIDAVAEEAREYRGERISSVFIGGGTPTILTPAEITTLLSRIGECFDIDADAEYSVEANPGTLTPDKAAALAAGGVNRLSIGVQSFNDTELHALGRIHTAAEAFEAVELAQKYFARVSVDLMAAIPQQTSKSLLESLAAAVSLGVGHISCYSLILEEGTPMYDEYTRGTLDVPDEDTERDMYYAVRDYLRAHGFERYEISNFARKGEECRHNIRYWQCGEYIGIGAGAHSYFEGARFNNTADVREYITGDGRRENYTRLTQRDMTEEFMIMGLRMSRGVSEREFRRRFGLEMRGVYGTVIDKFTKGGFLRCENGNISLTDRGIDVSNSVMCEFCG